MVNNILVEINGEVVLDLAKLEDVLCKCGHSIMTHYFCEGCCDRSGCGCQKFEQEVKNEIT